MELGIVCVVLTFVSCLAHGSAVQSTMAKKLIVVLVDGVRWDDIDDRDLKGFQRIIKKGVRARYVVPVFPSLSYPNYQTIATGLYPENHGFVGNYFYDPRTNSTFRMIPEPGADAPHFWNDSEPIWITAEKNGIRSALYWWAGCEVEIREGHPTICERQIYGPPTPELKADFLERIDDVIEMFNPPENARLSLAMMYYGSVDWTGHKSGVKSAQRQNALRDIDDILDKMQNKIKKAGLEDEVNIMVVSDHGMTNVENFKAIALDKFASKILLQLDSSAFSMIVPRPGKLDELYQEMTEENIEGLLIYKKKDLPDKYHLAKSYNTAPLILIAKKGYYIDKHSSSKPRGSHGFDPDEVVDMRTMFIASGPDFQRKMVVEEPLHNVDFYNVMCNILKIPPRPNNGSWERVEPMLLKNPQPMPIDSSSEENRLFAMTLIATVISSLFHLLNFRCT